jgi:hypothetical protein
MGNSVMSGLQARQKQSRINSVPDYTKLKAPMVLVGYVSRDKASHQATPNATKLAMVEECVRQSFWSGPIYLHNQDRLMGTIYPYPECFAAGWYIKEAGNEVKQTVLVVHGSSLLDARNQLNIQAQMIDWG